MKKRNPLLIAGFALLALTSIAALVYVLRFSNKVKIKSVTPKELHEGKDSIVKIIGKNFPDSNRLTVDLGGIPGRITKKSNNEMSVVVDLSGLKQLDKGEDFIEELVIRLDSNKLLYGMPVSIKTDKTIVLDEMKPSQFRIGQQLTVKGNNLNQLGRIAVYFGKNSPGYYNLSQMQKAALTPVSRKEFKITVPAIPDVEPGKPNDVNINVALDGNVIYTALGTVPKRRIEVYPGITDIIKLNKTRAYQ